MLCPSCGFENAETAKFCSECGEALAAAAIDRREERKVVTVVFADLVGSTARAETLDPEDVRKILAPYHDRLRDELERHGGTVEKFIGDAVVGVFGAPIAHEDDPERAVRAALSIQGSIAELNEADPALELEVRVGVHTGEALVSLAARPERGEAMVAGDVMNTAARLQSGAPGGGILVGDTTYRMTERLIEYERSEPLTAKGKAQQLDVWLALAPRARFGVDVAGAGRAPLVGRARELDALADAFARVREEREPQLVTLVGVPGIGKSRLLYELSQIVDADPELVIWRQGRSLPYGEGVAYWALGEMVKAQAGFLDTDDAKEVEEKLKRAIADLVSDEGEAAWIERHLRALVGLVPGDDARGEQKDEAAAAWRRFVEALAEWRPAVLVFEDLHWADGGLLDFVEELVDWLRGVPLLVVATARPELLERRPTWGGGKRNAVTLSLAPLSDDETARLIGILLERSVLPAETQATLLAAAAGNPLYAEEFARLHTGDGDDAEVPRTLQAILAARVDSLPPAEKSLLQAAAVLGKVFWSSALEAIAGAAAGELDQLLRALERKEFVRREGRSSVESEQQYVFLHALIRDVAYGQLPRTERADKHRRAGEWIESLGRAEDHAELVAHHYSAALELARAAGLPTGELEERARYAFRRAGDRASRLLAPQVALGHYAAALELWPRDDPDRATLLLALGREEMRAFDRGDERLREAGELLLAAGDVDGAAEAESLISMLIWRRGDTGLANEHLRRAVALLDDASPSRVKADVLTALSGRLMLNEEWEEAMRVGEQALRIAEQVGADDARVGTLLSVGSARLGLGNWEEGLEDLERAVALAREVRSWQQQRTLGMLRDTMFELGQLERSSLLLQEGLVQAERATLGGSRWLRGERASELYHLGSWDESLALIDAVVGSADEPWWFDPEALRVRALIRLARGDSDGALDDASVAVERARPAENPQVLYPALVVRALVGISRDDRSAEAFADELVERWRANPAQLTRASWILDLARILLALGREDEFGPRLEGLKRLTPWAEAAAALATNDSERAVALLGEIGSRTYEAIARMAAGSSAVAAGRRADADVHLRAAAAYWKSVGASAYLRETEALLAAAS